MHTEQRLVGKKLSKAVLDLKFMKKSKEKAQLQEENEERQNLYQDQLSSLHEGADKIVMINSYYDCLDFLPCRLSFGGMDVDIEKLNEDKLKGMYKVIKTAPPEKVTEMDTDVTAEELTKCYQPTNKYRKRKSDHLDDFDTKSKREDEGSDFCDADGERTFNSNERNYESASGERPFSSNSSERNDSALSQDKLMSKMLGNRRIFGGNSQGRGDFKGKDRGRGNFRGRGRGRGRGNFRGRGRGRGNFRGRGRGSDSGKSNILGIDNESSFKGTDQSKGRFWGSTRGHKMGVKDENIDNRHSKNKTHAHKKFKFMKPQD